MQDARARARERDWSVNACSFIMLVNLLCMVHTFVVILRLDEVGGSKYISHACVDEKLVAKALGICGIYTSLDGAQG